MKLHTSGTVAAALACVGMLIPPSAFAAGPIAPTTPISDVALRPGGLLVGQVVDQQGVARVNMPVSIQFAGREVVSTTTDSNGVFAAKDLRGGQYQILTPGGGSVCRFWAADTAPPSARPAALVVFGDQVIRGQGVVPSPPTPAGGPMNSWVEWMKMHPYLVAGSVGTAIAVPLVLATDDWDSGS